MFNAVDRFEKNKDEELIVGVTYVEMLVMIKVSSFFFFLGLPPWHMEVPRLEVQSEL